MLMYQKTMFDRYYCTKSFNRLKLWKKRFERFIFVLLSCHKIREGFVGFEKACFRAKTYVILTLLNNVNFYARYC